MGWITSEDSQLDEEISLPENVASSIIDVDILPTEDINPNVLYRVSTEPNAYAVLADGKVYTFPEVMFAQYGITMIQQVFVVDTLPEDMQVTTQTEAYLYILEGTGSVYFNQGTGAVKVSAAFGAFDGGWIDDVYSDEAVIGCVYAVKAKSELYVYCNNSWRKVSENAPAYKKVTFNTLDELFAFVSARNLINTWHVKCSGNIIFDGKSSSSGKLATFKDFFIVSRIKNGDVVYFGIKGSMGAIFSNFEAWVSRNGLDGTYYVTFEEKFFAYENQASVLETNSVDLSQIGTLTLYY
jgi:hypothetical protein